MKEVLIYSHKRSNRLTYICNYIFRTRFGLELRFTNQLDEARSSQSCVVNYSDENLDGSFQISPAKLLFEKRIIAQEQEIRVENQVPFLYASESSAILHDVFAACFFLLSRYEEYLPHLKDEHDRFRSSECLLARYEALDYPVVDHYIEALGTKLKLAFPQLEIRRPEFRDEITVDVDQLLMFKSKGMARTILGFFAGILKAPGSLSERLDTLLGQKKDPLEIYDYLLQLSRNVKVKPIFFFQVGETTRFDMNNPVHLPHVKQRINELSIDADIGLHPSYYSSENEAMIEKEMRRLQNLCNSLVSRSRQHYLRFRLPHTFRRLEELGITHDYSMGFADANGFRAGTSHPFPFFDLERDEAGRIMIHPIVFMDMVAVRKCSDTAESIEQLQDLRQKVRKFGGVFSTVWHPEVLVGAHESKPSMPIFQAFTSNGV